ncbi:DUF6355 family natural product biosynthesis protein [Amycolatopsis sp. TRM77291]
MKLTGTLRRVAGSGTAIAFISALLLSPAPGAGGATIAEHEAGPCGYYTAGVNAFFNNCGTTSIAMKIEKKAPKRDEIRCLRPGDHDLGPAQDIVSLLYLGSGC